MTNKEYILLKQTVAARAGQLCEYCKNPKDYCSAPFELEHIIPKSIGGATDLENLAFSCPFCNCHKATRVQFRDPFSKQIVPLFNPRQAVWEDHFDWDITKTFIIGKTEIARATIACLKMNRVESVNLRSLLVMANLHPPK